MIVLLKILKEMREKNELWIEIESGNGKHELNVHVVKVIKVMTYD